MSTAAAAAAAAAEHSRAAASAATTPNMNESGIIPLTAVPSAAIPTCDPTLAPTSAPLSPPAAPQVVRPTPGVLRRRRRCQHRRRGNRSDPRLPTSPHRLRPPPGAAPPDPAPGGRSPASLLDPLGSFLVRVIRERQRARPAPCRESAEPRPRPSTTAPNPRPTFCHYPTRPFVCCGLFCRRRVGVGVGGRSFARRRIVRSLVGRTAGSTGALFARRRIVPVSCRADGRFNSGGTPSQSSMRARDAGAVHRHPLGGVPVPVVQRRRMPLTQPRCLRGPVDTIGRRHARDGLSHDRGCLTRQSARFGDIAAVSTRLDASRLRRRIGRIRSAGVNGSAADKSSSVSSKLWAAGGQAPPPPVLAHPAHPSTSSAR